MKVAELIKLLEGLPEDADIRIAQQPNWPFEYGIADAVLVGPDARPPGYEPDPDEYEDEQPDENVVYLVEGAQLGYLPGVVAREIGWR
ncbi:hypothetical protein OKW45_001974 [Paraburkholderia sp. WSM4175]|uniref:hypothetical protein n=1 Tax=Paraburkholderia sp. WSM4175 TaxID=2991072 RepID=UPI003D23F018